MKYADATKVQCSFHLSNLIHPVKSNDSLSSYSSILHPPIMAAISQLKRLSNIMCDLMQIQIQVQISKHFLLLKQQTERVVQP